MARQQAMTALVEAATGMEDTARGARKAAARVDGVAEGIVILLDAQRQLQRQLQRMMPP